MVYCSNDTSVVTVDGDGNFVAVGEGVANVTISFAGNGKYLASNATVKVTVSKISTAISVVGGLDVYVGDGGNLNASLTPSEAGVLVYCSNDTSVVTVDGDGNFVAVGEGVANVTVTFEGNERYIKTQSYAIVNVTRKNIEIIVNKTISIYVDENKEINAEINASEGTLTFISTDSSVVSVDENGQITGHAIGEAIITINYSGSAEYQPASVNVTVKVVLIPTEIIVDKTIGLLIDSTTNINATLSHPEAGSLVYISDNEDIVIVDENGELITSASGNANITIKFAGNDKYAPCNATVLVSVYRLDIPTQITLANETINLFIGDEINVAAELDPTNAGNLIYDTTDSNIVVVDSEGNIHAVGIGVANVTINFAGNDRFKASNASAKIIVSRIPTEINVENGTITLNLTESTTINARLSPSNAGNLTYISSDSSVVSVDENGIITAHNVGNATITISYSGNENYTGAADVNITVNVITVPTVVIVNESVISLFVGDESVVNASLNYADAGDLVYVSSDVSVVSVDGSGRVVGVGEGVANITVSFAGNGKYLASNATVQVTVSRIPTEIILNNGSVVLNLTDSFDVGAVLSPAVAGDLVYVSSDDSIVSVVDGVITAVGEGNATVTVSFAGNGMYSASEATVNVTVTTVPTVIIVNESVISLFVGDESVVNASLNYADAGDLVYVSSDVSVVSVDGSGRVVGVGEGVANITVSFAGNGKYLASNATVQVTVSRIPTEIIVNETEYSLFVDDEFTLNITLNHPEAGKLIFASENNYTANVDENGNIIAKHEGTTKITVTYSGNNKYLPSEKEINVNVSRIPTEITVNADTINLEVGISETIRPSLNPKAGALNYTSTNTSVVEVEDGLLFPVSLGTANITISFAGNDKYAPSNATVTVNVDARATAIEVVSNVTLTVEDKFNLDAMMYFVRYHIYQPTEELIYVSSNPTIVSVDGNGQITALKKGNAIITVTYPGYTTSEGHVVNYPSNATVNVTVISKPSEINLKTGEVSLTVGENKVIVASLKTPSEGTLIFKSNNENIVTVDENGKITAVGKGNAIITVSFAGNEDYLASSKNVTVRVSPIPTEINVTQEITLGYGGSVELNATLSPVDGILNYHSSDQSIAVVDASGKVTGIKTGTAVITVEYLGNNQYDASFRYVTVYVSLKTTNIVVDKNVDLEVGGRKYLNATLNPEEAGYLEYLSSDESVVKVDSNGNLRAIALGTAVITIKYAGDEQYLPSEVKVNVTVNKINAAKFTVITKDDSYDTSYSVTLPTDAHGTFTVLIDGKKVASKSIQKGKATISAKNLSPGNHKVTLKYSGDNKYLAKTFTKTIHIYVYKIDKNKDVTVLYTAKQTYVVHLTRDTKAMGGKKVTFLLNGKKFYAKTNYLGYATFKLNLAPRLKPYTITAMYANAKVTNKFTVKHIVQAKNFKVSKSAKTTKFTVSLMKVGGKYLAGKKVTITLNGKVYTGKTNSKGVATISIAKSEFSKLTVGKTYTYIVKFDKDRIKKYIVIGN